MYRWVINIASNSHFEHIDNVGVFQRTEKRDFSDRSDRGPITFLRAINPNRLQRYDLAGPTILSTTSIR